MLTWNTTRSARIRARLDHPVIDSDGHLIELTPVLHEYIRRVGGGDMVRAYRARKTQNGWQDKSLDGRRAAGAAVQPWWALPARNTRDRATASLPRLLAERMDEMGLDFCVLYPTAGLGLPHIREDELQRVACRALNTYLAEIYGPYADRMTPAAIPSHTPREALAGLEYAVNILGLKTALIPGYVRRPIAELLRESPNIGEFGDYLDTYGVDSPYDYDPFWARCVELGVVPATLIAGSNPNSFKGTRAQDAIAKLLTG
jgi:hypothetical protein